MTLSNLKRQDAMVNVSFFIMLSPFDREWQLGDVAHVAVSHALHPKGQALVLHDF